MLRSTLLLLTICMLLAGCGGATSRPPFEGHWQKYEDERGGFVEFSNGQMTLGDKTGSRSGPYTFQAVSEEEPLYGVHANLSNGTVDLQVYYDGDTINLISDEDKVKGMYEMIVELVPIEH